MKRSAHRQRRLLSLYRSQQGKCHYCKQEMLLMSGTSRPKKGEQKPPRMATLEHLYPRYHPKREDPSYRNILGETLVAACFECNGRKDQEFRRTPSRHPAYRALQQRRQRQEQKQQEWRSWAKKTYSQQVQETPKVGVFLSICKEVWYVLTFRAL